MKFRKFSWFHCLTLNDFSVFISFQTTNKNLYFRFTRSKLKKVCLISVKKKTHFPQLKIEFFTFFVCFSDEVTRCDFFLNEIIKKSNWLKKKSFSTFSSAIRIRTAGIERIFRHRDKLSGALCSHVFTNAFSALFSALHKQTENFSFRYFREARENRIRY